MINKLLTKKKNNVFNYNYSIFLLNPSFLTDSNYLYYNLYNQDIGSLTYSNNSYILIDLYSTALATRSYGSIIDNDGVVNKYSLPKAAKQNTMEFKVHLIHIIENAIQSIYLNSILSNQIYIYNKLIIPLMIIRNHHDYNPLDNFISSQLIKKELLKLLSSKMKIQAS